MNCVEFRRQLAIDPHASAADFVQHRAECPRCAEAHARALTFEHGLARALNVAVPAQLAEAILFAQTTAERRRRTGLRRISMFAVAAALVLAIGVVGMRAEAKPLSVQAVEHLRKEEDVLVLTKPIAANEVSEVFAKRGVVLKQVPLPTGLRGRSMPVGNGTLILLAKSSAEFARIGNLWRAAIAG